MLVIDSFEHLNALLKLLWAVKFGMPTEDSVEFGASPYIAEIYRQTYRAAIDLLKKKNLHGEARKLEEQLTGSLKFEIKSVEKHLDFLKDTWLDWELEKKRGFVRTLMSPFVLPDEVIDEIINKRA
jgi:hypothetical protein